MPPGVPCSPTKGMDPCQTAAAPRQAACQQHRHPSLKHSQASFGQVADTPETSLHPATCLNSAGLQSVVCWQANL